MGINFIPISLPLVPRSYSGLPDTVTERSQFPRAEVSFFTNDAVIDAGGVGDSQYLQIAGSLPSGFAYVFRECHMGLQASATLEDWDDVATMQIANASSGPTYQASLPLVSPGLSQNLTRKWYSTPVQPLKQVVLPKDGENWVEFNVYLTNQALNGQAAVLHLIATFLQFDIEQSHYFEVNNPTPVR